ncbi:transporter substrate-binding domain-containing protein [Burkholderiaceae bacterium DAT-1]|nr:transporter substrate-binding domain-containing protein [Burkholderiaceae bacterium DAT-1]
MKRYAWGCVLIVLCCAHAHAALATLRVGFSNNKPPYIFEKERRGLEYDIVVSALVEAGFEVKPFFAPIERLHVMIAHRQLDAITTTNSQSGLTLAYSDPYIEYQNYAVALSARKVELNQMADLANYSVSSFQRARKLLGPEFEQVMINHPKYVEEGDQGVRNLLLFSGRVDVVVGERRIIEWFSANRPGKVNMRQPVTWYKLFPPTSYSVGFVRADYRDLFNVALAGIRRKGRYADIERRYEND